MADQEGRVATPKRRILYLLAGGLLLALGTPTWLALSRPGLKTYLLQPVILATQAVPYLVAAGLWLPVHVPRRVMVAQVLAGVLFIVATLLYVPMLAGPWATGGDMVGLGFFLIAATTTAGVFVVTLIAWGVLWWRTRGLRR